MYQEIRMVYAPAAIESTEPKKNVSTNKLN